MPTRSVPNSARHRSAWRYSARAVAAIVLALVLAFATLPARGQEPAPPSPVPPAPPAADEPEAEPTPPPAAERPGGWRLADSTSLYLREHAENPVEWYPWGDEAFARARATDRPILLSIGYSSCHWCHVMRRESFSDEEIAAYLSDRFVCIKVDREDQPHVDAIYMDAVRAMTGRGGWPLTVFLTPDGTPFFGGTYFPPEPRPGLPGFPSLLARIDQLWREEREQVLAAGTALTEHLARLGDGAGPAIEAVAAVDLAIARTTERYDSRHGGWGSVPKFPDPRLVDLLLASSALGGDPAERTMALETLRAMRAGGVYDQIRGGFHRYSVDAQWAVPHFEKMLYSQGLLGESYVEAFLRTGDPAWGETAREILNAMLLDFRLPSGAFAASWDADSGGEEGSYYVWTPDELTELLGERDGAVIARLLGITEEGNFSGGRSVPSRRIPLEEVAKEFALGREQARRIMADAFEAMRARRATRVAPKRDDKVILGWNATAISALARGAVALRDDRYRRAAVAALETLRGDLVTPEGFRRRRSEGEVAHAATLVDAALYLKAVLDLAEATFDPTLVPHARAVARAIERDFGPPPETPGAFRDAPRDLELPLPSRTMHFGGALPAGNGTQVRNLLRLHALTGEAAYLATADAILAEALPAIARAPGAAPELMLAALQRVTGTPAIVVSGDLRLPTTRALLEPVLRGPFPFRVVAHRPVGPAGEAAAEAIPIVAGRAPIGGRPTAWFCVDFVCEAPTSEPAALAASRDGWIEEAAERRAARRRAAEEAARAAIREAEADAEKGGSPEDDPAPPSGTNPEGDGAPSGDDGG